MAFYEGQPINGFTGIKSSEEINDFQEVIDVISTVSSQIIEDVNKKLELAGLLLEKKEVDKSYGVIFELISSDFQKKWVKQ